MKTTQKQVRREVERHLGEDWRKHYRVGSRRRDGRCQIVVRSRSSRSIRYPHILRANAPTWAAAMRQAKGGYSEVLS